MRFAIRVDLPDPAAQAALCRALLDAVVLGNRILIRQAIERGRPFPSLYQSGVRYQREPGRGKPFQELADLRTVLKRGWGDCKHLSAWRCAELQEAGENAGIVVYWRPDRRGRPKLYHAEVRRAPTAEFPRGEREDPSRLLGM